MYGDDEEPAAAAQRASSSNAEPAAVADISDAVMWEYKWTNDDGAETFGPYSSETMLQWRDGICFYLLVSY